MSSRCFFTSSDPATDYEAKIIGAGGPGDRTRSDKARSYYAKSAYLERHAPR